MTKDQYLKGLSDGAREYWGIQLDIGRHKNIIHLYLIHVPEEMRGYGHARRLLNLLVGYADRENFIVTLHPTAEYGSDYTKLCNFYLQLGFTFNTGCDYREDICETMYRLPQATERKV